MVTEIMDVFINLIAGIISQCICILKQHVIYLNIYISFYLSIAPLIKLGENKIGIVFLLFSSPPMCFLYAKNPLGQQM